MNKETGGPAFPRNATECAESLRKFNEWRRFDGDCANGPAMPHPKEIGVAIDTAIGLIGQNDNLLSAMRKAVVAGAHPSIEAKEDCYNILNAAIRAHVEIVKGGA